MRSPLTWSHSKIEKGRNKDISLKKAHRISGVRARDACRLARQWVRRSTKALRPLHQPPHTHSIHIYSNSLGGAEPDNDLETTQGPNLSTDQSDPDLLSNTKRSPNVGLMLGQRRQTSRHWGDISCSLMEAIPLKLMRRYNDVIYTFGWYGVIVCELSWKCVLFR